MDVVEERCKHIGTNFFYWVKQILCKGELHNLTILKLVLYISSQSSKERSAFEVYCHYFLSRLGKNNEGKGY